jgi:hypothetical protein
VTRPPFPGSTNCQKVNISVALSAALDEISFFPSSALRLYDIILELILLRISSKMPEL